MRHQLMLAIAMFLFCATMMVSANPIAPNGDQSRAISFPDIFKPTGSFCMPVLCFAPCMCGSQLDYRGCNSCNCLPCFGSQW